MGPHTNFIHLMLFETDWFVRLDTEYGYETPIYTQNNLHFYCSIFIEVLGC